MGNRAYDAMLARYPWLRRKARGFHANGPDVEQKRIWAHRLRARWRQLARRDEAAVAWPTRAGDRWEWY